MRVNRANSLLSELISEIKTQPPYTYVLETNTSTNFRATLAKRNEEALDSTVIRCGEILHNLRSALDHAYYEAVTPFVTDKKKLRNVQFPFTKDEKNLEEVLTRRSADKVGENFLNAIRACAPHPGKQGNTLLALIHEININDKHKFPIPVGNYTKITSECIKKQVPDFPAGLSGVEFGNGRKDVTWKSTRYNRYDLGDIIPPHTCLYHKVIDTPVETWFNIESPHYEAEIISTLNNMINEMKNILLKMQNALI